MSLLEGARAGFLLACAGALGMILVMALLPGGAAAVSAIAGLGPPAAPEAALRLAMASDLLLPVGYAAGFVLLACGLARGPRGWLAAGAVIVLTLAGLVLDLGENALALRGLASEATPAKYGALGAAAFVLSALMGGGAWAGIARAASRYAAPPLLAFTVAAPPAWQSPWLFSPVILGLFAALALVAHEALREREVER